ncbi:MAG: RDD family protein [Desmonostoc vinosum HA7617-LM4]|jgi:serine/threonine protein kinase|nr:RDD family protein [Desmonostoc vinosum HA7617-LM4]
MSYCINPSCPKPQNSGNFIFCQTCGSEMLLQGCYRVTHLLSNPNKPSGFGTIYEVEDASTKKILKILHNTHPKAVELFQQEAEVLSRLQHPGIPTIENDGYFTYFPRNSQNPLHCLVMEKIEGLNLEEYLIELRFQPIPERTARRWLKQLIEILQAIHQQQYFHRDIKPPNIMLKPDGQLALIDFGTAREVTQTFMQKLQGQQVTGIISPGYTPTEQIHGKAVPQSDFFALGRTFVYLLTGKQPSDFSEDARTGELIWRGSANISPKFADLINYLMAPFPGNRPQNTQEILQKIVELNPNLQTPEYVLKNSSSTNTQVNQVGINRDTWTIISSTNQILWKRILAYLIDLFLVGVWIGICFGVATLFYTIRYDFYYLTSGYYAILMLLFFIMIIGVWLYFALSESSSQQATIGKKKVKIIVTNLQGNRITFWQATWRLLLKVLFTFLSIIYVIGLIDFIFALSRQDKRSLHDILSRTMVVNK